VVVPEIPRAYDADDSRWLAAQQSTTGSAVTSQQQLQFTSGLDRKYYDFVPPPLTELAELGGYGASGFESRPPPPCYPTKREDGVNGEILVRAPETDNRKFYTGSSYSDAAYFAPYGPGAFPVLIDHGQYGGGVATASVLSDARQPNYIIPACNATTTGTGSSCAGYLSVDVGGFGSTMLRPLGFQSSAWPAAFRQ